MPIKGKGAHRRSRKRLTIQKDKKGKIELRKALQSFNEGERVLIAPSAYFQRNIPHRRFFGVQGTVIRKKGKAYSIRVVQGSANKVVDLLPVHLKKL
ncbi:MAG: 50S ribosomal protein L21e [Candidatus Parvarchaeota archaeon]|nr:50S ribosomal protein L21e [Candidatus Parvarchaeota archaeon]